MNSLSFFYVFVFFFCFTHVGSVCLCYFHFSWLLAAVKYPHLGFLIALNYNVVCSSRSHPSILSLVAGWFTLWPRHCVCGVCFCWLNKTTTFFLLTHNVSSDADKIMPHVIALDNIFILIDHLNISNDSFIDYIYCNAMQIVPSDWSIHTLCTIHKTYRIVFK